MTGHPHTPYITAVTDALTAAGLPPADSRTDDSDTRGSHCYLNAVITLDPNGTHDLDHDDIPPGTAWPHGLLLIWEWHTGIEADDGEPDRGPAWQFAELKNDGSNQYPTTLPVYGYASPAAVVDAARRVIAREVRASVDGGWPHGWDGALVGGSWDRADELEAACEAWGGRESVAS